MSVGGNHICAILDDSSLQCWGENSNGQLGDGTTIDRLTMTEVSLPTGRTAVSVSAGHDHTCAVWIMAIWCAGGRMSSAS